MTLLRDIETAAVDSAIPLPDLLRKCKVLAQRLKHSELATWTSHELNGYPDNVDVPDYRCLSPGPSLGHFVGSFGRQLRNAPLPTTSLPKRFQELVGERKFRQPVGTLVGMLEAKEGTLMWKWPAELVTYMSHRYYEDFALVDAFQIITPAGIKGILDTIRTRILEFTLAIQTDDPDAGEALPNAPPPLPAQRLNQYFHTTIIGGQANLGNMGPATIGHGNVATGKYSPGAGDDALKSILQQLRTETQSLPDDDQNEALDAIAKIETHASKDKPDLQRLKQYVELYATLATVTSPTLTKLIEHFGPAFAALFNG